jgi:hypothetical protein
VPLIPHASSPPIAVRELQVEIDLSHPGLVTLWYTVFGSVDELVLPQTNPPSRADRLWETTCFELFARARGGAYHEYNFSPSSDWAAYRFGGYRDGREALPLQHEPIISYTKVGSFELHVTLPVELGDSRLGLSAVIEERNGRMSYWALAHPPGAPDFHHPDCFALELPAARPA